MASVAAKYAQGGDNEGDRPLKVCADAGRKCVKSIQRYEVLSVEWINLVDSLRQLTRLVHLESRMPGDAKVAEAHGRNKDGVGTLWDQEDHETAIRILVEEAKVNLCLRIMDDFKTWQYDEGRRDQSIRVCAEAFHYGEDKIHMKIREFEVAMGLLLLRALMHVETLQLMEVPLLVEYMSKVLQHSSLLGDDEAAKGTQLQETVVLFYFRSLMKHAESLNNTELLAKCEQLQVPHFVVSQVLRNLQYYDMDVKIAIAEGLAHLADNEDFQVSWQNFFTDDNQKVNFLALEEGLTAAVLQAHPEKTKDIRPLLDFFKTLKRSR